MRKRFSLLLAILFCCTSMLGGFAEGLEPGWEFEESLAADDVVQASLNAEPEVGAEELPEFSLPEDDPESDEAHLAADVSEQSVSVRYARVISDGAEVLTEAGQRIASLPVESVVLLTEGSMDSEWVRVAFNTVNGVVEGVIDCALLMPLDQAACDAFMESLAASGEVETYQDNLDMPLPLLECVPEEEEETSEIAEAEAEEASEAEDESPSDVHEDHVTVESTEAGEGEASEADDEAPAIDAAASDGDENEEEAEIAENTAEGQNSENAAQVNEAEPNREPAIDLSASEITIGVNEKYAKLTACALDARGEEVQNVALTWKSSNSKLVKVNASGVITGVEVGSATVTVSVQGYASATVQVTVKKAPSKITLSAKSMNLIAGHTASIVATPSSGSASGSYSYQSSKAGVASVDQNGVIMAHAKGSVTITVKSFNGKKATCKVTVYGKPVAIQADESLTIAVDQKKSIAFNVVDADGDVVVSAEITPRVTQGADCVDVDSATGAVTGKKKGNAVVTFTCGNLSAECRIKVANAPERVTLNQTTVEIGVKEAYRGIRLNLVPASGEESCAAIVTWTTSNKKVAAVSGANDETCVITGVKKGTAKITATTHNGKTATVVVTVKNAPSKITANPATMDLIVGESARVNAMPTQGTASASYTYISNNEAVAKVDASGTVTALGKGMASVTVKAFNGKKAECKVTVHGVPESIELGQDEIDIIAGQSIVPEITVKDVSGSVTLARFEAHVDENSVNPGSVRVDAETGVITGISKGSAKVIYKLASGASAQCTVNVVSAPESIAIEPTAIEIGVKEQYTGASLTLNPPEGETRCAAIVTWKSSNAKVAKVVKNGEFGCTITGIKAGKATITATTHNGKAASIVVTVRKAPGKVTVTPSKLELSVGMSGSVAAATDKGTASSVITYTSANEAVATVDANGVVKGVSVGSTTVTAKTYNGKKGKCVVTVFAEPASVTLDKTALVIADGLTSKLTAMSLDAVGKQTRANFTFSSSDASVAKVNASSGLITAVKKGNATITVTTNNGMKATSAVQVVSAPAELKLIHTEISIGVGEKLKDTLCELVAPEGESQCAAEIKWTSSNTRIVKVTGSDCEPVVTGVKAGTAKITALTHNGLSKTIKVKVLAAPKKLKLTPNTVTTVVGKTAQLTTEVDSGAASAKITFTSSNQSVATVSASGKVTGVGKGSATITAKTYNGKSASCTVKILGVPAQVFITDSLKLAAGMSGNVTAKAIDADGDDTLADYTFTVNDETGMLTVDQTGKVTALTPGIGYIKVRTDNGITRHVDLESGESVETVCKVTITQPPASISLPQNVEIDINESYTVVPVIKDTDGNALDVCDYTISIQSGSAAKLTGGNVLKGLDVGYVTLIARTYNGFSATCKVLVKRRYRLFAAYSFFKTGMAGEGELPFTKNNATSVKKVFAKSSIYGMKYESVGLMENPSKSGLLNGIVNAFSDSRDTDVSVVYLCSHGYNNVDGKGSASNPHYGLQLPGYDKANPDTYITSSEIFNAVNTIKGKVILILDSCYSGCFIDNMLSKLKAQNGRITVMCAATNTRACYYNVNDTSVACDFFTYYLLEGAGYDEKTGKFSSYWFADVNEDGKLTVNELFDNAKAKVIQYVPTFASYSWFHGDANQTPRIYAGKNGDLVIYQK